MTMWLCSQLSKVWENKPELYFTSAISWQNTQLCIHLSAVWDDKTDPVIVNLKVEHLKEHFFVGMC